MTALYDDEESELVKEITDATIRRVDAVGGAEQLGVGRAPLSAQESLDAAIAGTRRTHAAGGSRDVGVRKDLSAGDAKGLLTSAAKLADSVKAAAAAQGLSPALVMDLTTAS